MKYDTHVSYVNLDVWTSMTSTGVLTPQKTSIHLDILDKIGIIGELIFFNIYIYIYIYIYIIFLFFEKEHAR
jgi:hypothetical protein